MEIGERIKIKRKEMGLTQEDLATKLNVTFQAVSKWENNTSTPEITSMNNLAKALNTTLDYLINGIEPEGSSEETERPYWGNIMGTVTKDIHGDVGNIRGDVKADIYGNVHGDIVGTVRNIFGNVEGKIIGEVQGNIDGYVKGKLIGTVYGIIKLGVHDKILGSAIGDGINADESKKKKKKKDEE